MKLRSIFSCVTAIAALGGMPNLAHQATAAPTPMAGQVTLQFGSPKTEPMNFTDDQQQELRRIYWRLEKANREYDGHRHRAVEEIRKAAEIMGMDLHGRGYAPERQSQEWSDRQLRESRDQLSDLAHDIGGDAGHHLHEAVHQLDRALEYNR